MKLNKLNSIHLFFFFRFFDIFSRPKNYHQNIIWSLVVVNLKLVIKILSNVLNMTKNFMWPLPYINIFVIIIRKLIRNCIEMVLKIFFTSEAYINENSDEEFEVSVHECNENDPEKCDDVNQRTSLTLNDNETCDGDIQMTSPPLNDSETCDEDIQMIFDPNNNEYLNSVDEFDDLDSVSTESASETNEFSDQYLSDENESFFSENWKRLYQIQICKCLKSLVKTSLIPE